MHWKNDGHWTPAGHQWAAEAIWEYIEQEWNGECPSEVPDTEIEVDWITVGQRFHTAEGEVFVESFPALNPEGYESVYSSVVSGSAVASSGWNVYFYSNGLTYTLEPCSEEDTEKRFFLHVIPKDQNVLMSDRRPSGFDNVSFDFWERGERFDGKCIISTDLPEYDIASIRTGQIAEGTETWSIHYDFALPEILDAVQELQHSGREPEIRSSFDVYIDDNRIIYVKESCDGRDRDMPFFLHLFPADEKDLPSGREEFDFDNLDFELMRNGGESDGSCFAAVNLPDYKIARVRTGQWVHGEGNIWEASIELDE